MNLPDIRQLKILIALDETKSFTKAAAKNSITQSAVSHSIKSLEKQLDCPLMIRLNRTVTLTKAGQALTYRAKIVIKELETALALIEKIKDES